jgi:hypothetical protein
MDTDKDGTITLDEIRAFIGGPGKSDAVDLKQQCALRDRIRWRPGERHAKGDFVSLLFRSKISKWLFRQCIHHDLGLRIGENSTFCCASNAGRA